MTDHDALMAKHRKLYGDESTRGKAPDWDAYVAGYAEPWGPAYYLRGLDDKEGAAPVLETKDPDTGVRHVEYLIQGERRVGKTAAGPLGRLVVGRTGISLVVAPTS